MRRNLILFTVLLVGALVLSVAYIRRTPHPANSSPVVLEGAPKVPKEAIPQATPIRHTEITQITPQPSPPPMTESSPKPNDRLPKFSEGEPVRAKGLAGSIQWLGANETARFPFDQFRSKAVRISSDSLKQRPIASREDAVAHLNINLSMALRPSVAFEDDEFFYFSGGNTAYPVKDFSKGIAINKATGEITAW